VWPNPSFHPTCYGCRRQPSHAGELKLQGLPRLSSVPDLSSRTAARFTSEIRRVERTALLVEQGGD